MNRYRLLRNNKETGPFTAEELITKGFKPYDLIWVEGKSAGWRYPGELPEFAGVAPIVEEQPFDRFFKKETSTPPTITQQQEQILSRTTSASAEVSPRKVFVTMPANRTTKKIEPIVVSTPVPKQEKTPEFKVDSATRDEIRYNNLIDQFAEAPEKTADTIRSGKRTTRRLIRGALAACLLIGGVIIGYLVSNVKQQSEQEKLAALLASQHSTETTKPVPVENLNQNAPTTAPNDSVLVSAEDVASASEAAASMVVNTAAPIKRKSATGKTTPSLPVQQDPIVTNTVSVPVAEERVAVKKFVAPSEEQLMKLVTLQANNYKVGVLGGISNLKITVSNNSSFPLSSVVVAVQYLGPEGRIVKEQKINAESLKAGEQRELEIPKSGRGVKINYRLDRISASDNAVAQNSGE
ncbi:MULTISPECIES: hypothetical protein [unclassified Paraflavitalea]|uniref:hypothetical protein n=1 Tax=unclassified Paraflavitalea TaxID=2798305 RepID=UPI003D34A80F